MPIIILKKQEWLLTQLSCYEMQEMLTVLVIEHITQCLMRRVAH